MPDSIRELPLRQAAILGLLHGPTELLPISSSAHTTLVPWLAGWPYEGLDPRLRKSFEVALHAGTAAALLLRPPSESWRSARDGGGRTALGTVVTTKALPTAADPNRPSREHTGTRLGFLIAGLAPPALAGYVFGEQIERRLGTPTKIAYGLLAGTAAMGGVEVYKKWHAPCARAGHRHFESNTTPAQIDATRPTASDGLALGLAQALALIPGVSRSGATLAAARARGFSRQDADQLSWTVGLPVIAGATLLQGTRLVRQQARADTPRAAALPLAAGAASAFVSTLASSKALDRRRRAQLLPICIAYRGVLAAHVIRHMRDNTC
ncbi:MAG: undecaprenyl-diphosphate phosphatase [Solirubrobacteraceae bacterium]